MYEIRTLPLGHAVFKEGRRVTPVFTQPSAAETAAVRLLDKETSLRRCYTCEEMFEPAHPDNHQCYPCKRAIKAKTERLVLRGGRRQRRVAPVTLAGQTLTAPPDPGR